MHESIVVHVMTNSSLCSLLAFRSHKTCFHGTVVKEINYVIYLSKSEAYFFINRREKKRGKIFFIKAIRVEGSDSTEMVLDMVDQEGDGYQLPKVEPSFSFAAHSLF